jgi:lysophospholipid acyltransferase (LPLAT)-like uncharacterized protein
MNRGSPPRDLLPDLKNRLIGALGSWTIRILGATLNVEWIGRSNIERIEQLDERVVYAFWHAHLLTLTYTHRGRGAVVMVSRHSDGEIISQIVCRLGYGVVRGSTTRGGLRALLEMVRAGRDGYPLAVTPDGPRGPRHELQSGVLHIAQRSGMPIVPVAAEALRRTELDSWDRFQIPHPFSRVVIVVGSPLGIPREIPTEELERDWRPRVAEMMYETEEKARSWRVAQLGGPR